MIERIPILDISPVIFFGGEFVPAKAVADEEVTISATIIREGHAGLKAYAVLANSLGKEISRSVMREVWQGTDRYEGVLTPPSEGEFTFFIEATDPEHVDEVASKSASFPIRAERVRALFGSWYEFFPRSEGATKNAAGTFATAAKRLPAVADMGFDILYLPPVHPIGYSHRKGANNSLTALPSDPGVPWAIGNKDGGHDSINPELGTMAYPITRSGLNVHYHGVGCSIIMV